MRRITLVGTVHNERGLCNEHELLRILETISPEVIFEEMRPCDFESHYRDTSRHTLEMRAISRYLRGQAVRQVPVDDFVIPESYPRNLDILFDFIESGNMQYGKMIAERDQKTHHLGFQYLNSPEYKALSIRIHRSLETTIAMSGREDLRKSLAVWNNLMLRRENSMVNSIYEFCRNNSFVEGVFLIGAGHIPSVSEIITSRMSTETKIVAWNMEKLPD